MKAITFCSGLAAALLLTAQRAAAQPSIANVFPNGSYLFQSTNVLAFTATSSAGIANVSVTLTPTTMFGVQGFPQTLTSSSGLTISGSANNENVSAPLESNELYSVQIIVTDINNASKTNNVTFDTIFPSYTWEAKDWDYTSNSVTGLFIDNPQTNAYANLASTEGSDFHSGNSGSGGASYRPQGLETEGCGDVPRLAYSPFTGKADYDVGFDNGGNWGNYTRHYPPGVYNVFVRASDGNGPQHNAGDISVFAGSASFASSGPYYFSVKSTGWQTYQWYPLLDSFGNAAVLTIPDDGTASTLQVTVDGGNCNQHFYMLLPVNTNAPAVGEGSISNPFPDGTYQFQQTNTFNCSVSSPNGINNVVVQVSGTNLGGGPFFQNLTTNNGLTLSGTNLSFTLASNVMYSLNFLITDGANNLSTTNLNFDTIYPTNYTWEAEDWDYTSNGISGLFFDNPQTNAYFDLFGASNIDSYCPNGPNNADSYARGISGDGANMNTEPNGDVKRLAYINGHVDYDIGFTGGGQWGNYTRHYPAGVYNIYVRASSGGSGSTDSGAFSLVTGGYGTTSQTLLQLGTFSVPGTGGWQTYTWVPVLNSVGNLARFITTGSTQTLRMTLVGASCNLNCYMLAPANLGVLEPPFVSNFSPDGSAIFQPSNQVSFTVNSTAGISTNNVVLYLNGAKQSGLAFSGNEFTCNVTCPIKPNALYTAVITLSDAGGNTTYTNTFADFSASDYQWEAEDYDYTSNGVSGLFFDNPQVGSYSNLASTAGIDLLESDPNAFSRGYTYRSANGADFPDTTSGDLARPQFALAGGTDYSIGSFGPSSWANYTRHYPGGNYNVVGRFAEGAALSHATLSILTAGYGTSSPVTNFLGTFIVPEGGWSSWEWSPLVDSNGQLVTVALNGGQQTLQLGGSPNNTEPEVNVNFFMLVPTGATKLKATRSGSSTSISFQTGTGYTYQVQYKNHLSDATWTPLGSAVTGDGTIHVVVDSTAAASRFYRAQITSP